MRVRFLNSTLLLRVPVAALVGNVVAFQAAQFGCVYTMGFLDRATSYPNDGYEGVLLRVDNGIRSIDNCCEACTHVDTCTGCHVNDDSCYLVRDWQPGESVAGKTATTSASRVVFMSRNGCECQPTLDPVTSAFATCYRPGIDSTSPLRCAVATMDSCSPSVANATWDYCNGSFRL